MNDPNLYARQIIVDYESKVIRIHGTWTLLELYSAVVEDSDTAIGMGWPADVMVPMDRHTMQLADDWVILGMKNIVDKPVIRYPTIEYADGRSVWIASISENFNG